MFSISSAVERGSVAREPAAQDDAIPRRPQEIKIKRAESRGARGVVNPHQWAAEAQIVLKILRERANRGFIVDIRVEHTRRPPPAPPPLRLLYNAAGRKARTLSRGVTRRVKEMSS